MKRILLAALMSTCLAGQAVALSCAKPSVQSSFQAASASDATYVLAVGRIQVLPGQAIPDTGAVDPNDRQGYTLNARFVGKLASGEGFVEEASFPVVVDVQCAGAWCGGVSIDRVLAFVERREGGNVLVEGPCPQFVLRATPEVVDQAEACLRGEACEVPGE